MKVRRSSLIKWLVVFLILAAGCEDEETRRQLDVLHQIAAETPLHPALAQLRSSDFVNVGHAGVVRCYSAEANHADVRPFYSQMFASKGWTLTKEEERLGGFYPTGSYRLTFRKGAYAIVLEHSNLDPRSGECNYSLAYYWNPPTPLI